jgi:hypothetical protein
LPHHQAGVAVCPDLAEETCKGRCGITIAECDAVKRELTKQQDGGIGVPTGSSGGGSLVGGSSAQHLAESVSVGGSAADQSRCSKMLDGDGFCDRDPSGGIAGGSPTNAARAMDPPRKAALQGSAQGSDAVAPLARREGKLLMTGVPQREGKLMMTAGTPVMKNGRTLTPPPRVCCLQMLHHLCVNVVMSLPVDPTVRFSAIGLRCALARLCGCAVSRGGAADPPTEHKKTAEQKNNVGLHCAAVRLRGEPGRGRRPPNRAKTKTNRTKTLWTPL